MPDMLRCCGRRDSGDVPNVKTEIMRMRPRAGSLSGLALSRREREPQAVPGELDEIPAVCNAYEISSVGHQSGVRRRLLTPCLRLSWPRGPSCEV